MTEKEKADMRFVAVGKGVTFTPPKKKVAKKKTTPKKNPKK